MGSNDVYSIIILTELLYLVFIARLPRFINGNEIGFAPDNNNI